MTIQLRKHVSIAHVGDGSAILDEKSGRYWQFNATAALMVRMLLEGSGTHEVAQKVSEQYSVSAAQAAADVDSLVQDLRRAKLVKP